MKILHVTPHLPPDQAANAILPWQLGTWAQQHGDGVEYVAHPPRAAGNVKVAGSVTWVPRRRRRFYDRVVPLGAFLSGLGIRRALRPAIAKADLVHVHSNGLLAELGVLLSQQQQKPVILTLYGTEIWHYEPKHGRPDLFTRAYHSASAVTFYSERLLARARELGLTRRGMHAIYPPVADVFRWHDSADQLETRLALGIQNRHVLLNVKRLHPLAGQRYLIDAMNEVIRTHPDTR